MKINKEQFEAKLNKELAAQHTDEYIAEKLQYLTDLKREHWISEKTLWLYIRANMVGTLLRRHDRKAFNKMHKEKNTNL